MPSRLSEKKTHEYLYLASYLLILHPNSSLLDLGIIQNLKVHYRRLFLSYVLAKIDECDTASDVSKSVNILTAIKWVAKAWDMVKPETISKCFRNAGILSDSMGVITRGLNENDDDYPYLESDQCLIGLQTLIDKTIHECCNEEYVKQYVNFDGDLPVCTNLDLDWENNFLKDIVQPDQDDEKTDLDSDSIEDASPSILNIPIRRR